MRFGKDGVKGSYGTGGTDLNLGMVYNSINGFAHTKRITEMKLGSVTERTALEVIAMYDNTKNSDAHEHARKLFNKEEKLEFGSGADILNGEKRGYLGKYDPDKPFTITISEKMLGAKTQEEYAKIAAVAAHEGAHLMGEHIEANAYEQSLDVYTQVVHNLGLKGDSHFALGMIAGIMLPENQRPNTGGVEYWKLMKDGSLLNDGRSSFYHETEHGDECLIWDMEGITLGESLAKIMFNENPSPEAVFAADQLSRLPSMENIANPTLSNEAIKRAGIFKITSANSTLTQQDYEQIVNDSYYAKDVGIYVDFSGLTNKMNDDIPHVGLIRNPYSKGFALPDISYEFNEGTWFDQATLSLAHATMAQLGNYSEVINNPAFSGLDLPENKYSYHRVDAEDGSLEQGWQLFTQKANSAPATFGGSPWSSASKESVRPVFTNKDNMAYNANTYFSTGVMVAQAVTGVVQGLKVDNVYLDIWKYEDENFFTMQTPVLSAITNSRLLYSIQFLSARESKLPRYYNGVLDQFMKDKNKGL